MKIPTAIAKPTGIILTGLVGFTGCGTNQEAPVKEDFMNPSYPVYAGDLRLVNADSDSLGTVDVIQKSGPGNQYPPMYIDTSIAKARLYEEGSFNPMNPQIKDAASDLFRASQRLRWEMANTDYQIRQQEIARRDSLKYVKGKGNRR